VVSDQQQLVAGEVVGDFIRIGLQPFTEEGFHLVFANVGAGSHRPQLGDEQIAGVAADRCAEGGQAAGSSYPG
jgi:hypothetical protein